MDGETEEERMRRGRGGGRGGGKEEEGEKKKEVVLRLINPSVDVFSSRNREQGLFFKQTLTCMVLYVSAFLSSSRRDNKTY